MGLGHSQQVVSPPMPGFLSPTQSPGSPQQYIPAQHTYGQPSTHIPSPMSPPTQQYFPPPPLNAPSPKKDYFGQNNRVSPPNPQVQGCQQALPAPTPNYGSVQNGQSYHQSLGAAPPHGGQQGGNYSQGWQWGNSSAGAPGEPTYAPQPIPGKWRGS